MSTRNSAGGLCFNPYFVGDESGRKSKTRSCTRKSSFNPYFVGDESGSPPVLSRPIRENLVSILILLEMSLEDNLCIFIRDKFTPFQSLFCWR